MPEEKKRKYGAVVEERIQVIMKMMRDCTFRTGETGPEMAEKWGISSFTVDKYCQEASRRVLAEITNPEFVSATVGATLMKIVHDSLAEVENRKSLEKGDREPNSKHRQVAVQASKTWAELAGLIVQRMKVDIEKLSEEDLAKREAEILARVAARQSGLKDEEKDTDDSE